MQRRNFIQSLLALFGYSALPQVARAKPEAKPTLLQRSKLAGFQFYQGEQLWHQLHKGAKLQLKREAENTQDSNAIAIHWQQHKLGYIPRTDNVTLARLMDNHHTLQAQIHQLKTAHTPWERINISIWLKH